MKITGENSSINLGAYINNVSKNSKLPVSNKQTAQKIIQEDKVELSSKAKEICEAKKLLNAAPDVRDEMVKSIKNQIEQGTYQIKGDKVALKMIKESLLDELV